MVGGKGKAYLFIAQTGRYTVHIDLALQAMFTPLNADTGRSPVLESLVATPRFET
jgi:hypothetical protein